VDIDPADVVLLELRKPPNQRLGVWSVAMKQARNSTLSLRLRFGMCCVFIAILMSGCGDPVRTTLQPVLLEVTESISGQPVADAKVSLKYDCDHYISETDEWSEWKRTTYKWFSGTTDVDGEAEVGVVWTVLDRTIGPTPPPWRDDVTGKVYLVRVKTDQVQEEHSLAMHPSALIRGKRFTVHVLRIRQPQYVKTNDDP